MGSWIRRGGAPAVLLFLLVESAAAQQIPWRYAVILRGSFITTSRLFYNPDASVPEIRDAYVGFDDLSGVGAEIRMPIPEENFYLSLSVDFISKSRDQLGWLYDDARRLFIQAPQTEGIKFIPVELGVNAYIPLGSETIKLTMGGGFGIYYANRTSEIIGVSTKTTNTPIGYGIHVGIGVECRVWRSFLVQGDVRFRDPEITTETQYTSASAPYQGHTINIPQDPFKTKLNIDGMTLSLGVMMEL